MTLYEFQIVFGIPRISNLAGVELIFRIPMSSRLRQSTVLSGSLMTLKSLGLNGLIVEVH